MERQHGPWKILDSREVYHDSFVHVQLDRVIRPDTKAGNHVLIHMKPGVCVLPMGLNRIVYLTREFHYAIGRYSVEAVSGGIEPAESGSETARRELSEELGLEASHWQLIATVDPFTTIIRSPTQLYLAEGLTEVGTAPEGTEQIEKIAMPLAKAVKLIHDGTITHAPTCVLLLMVQSLRPE